VEAINHGAARGITAGAVRFTPATASTLAPRVHDMALKDIVDVIQHQRPAPSRFEAANPRHGTSTTSQQVNAARPG